MKKCTHCKEMKPRTEFYAQSATSDQLQSWCKECVAAYRREWMKKNPERGKELMANARMKHRGSKGTAADYDRLLGEQGGVCAICQMPPGERSLHLDHDHKTKEVRGVLCLSCNIGLGHFKDNPKLLMSAVEYLAGQPNETTTLPALST